MCTTKGRVCPLTSSNERVYETKSGFEQEKCGIWKTLKGFFSLYEIKEAGSQGEYFEWYLWLGIF